MINEAYISIAKAESRLIQIFTKISLTTNRRTTFVAQSLLMGIDVCFLENTGTGQLKVMMKMNE